MKLVLRYLLVILVICMFFPITKREVAPEQLGGGRLAGWYRDKQCKYELMHVLKTFIRANGLNQNTEDNWSIYLPCGYNRAENEYDQIKSGDPDQKIFIIKGHDNLSRKDYLWDSLHKQYGDRAKEVMPETFQLRNETDFQRLMISYDPKKVYIMKKNIQRQQGLKMTQDKLDLIQGRDQGFVIAQEMLQDPYLIDGRKTNCRVYLLVVCKGGKKSGYLYNNGYMYYTPKPFAKNSTEQDRVITAGLSTVRKDNVFYETHPLTIQEWQNTIPEKNLFERIGDLLAKVLKATSPKFCSSGHLRDQTTFQLFGCDIAFNDHLIPQLIEINKGPDLSSKSEKEATLKNDLIANVFKQVGVLIKTATTGKLLRVWCSKAQRLKGSEAQNLEHTDNLV